jgi:CheY-like chemotaxis protein
MTPGATAGAPSVSVLLVDDDLSIREVLVEILEDQGFSVATASNGAEALTLLGGIRPDLILLDLNMPVMNGSEFRKAQRSDPSLREIPTVVMSAVDRMPDQIADLAVSETLAKPVPLHDLLAVVERHSTRRPPRMPV